MKKKLLYLLFAFLIPAILFAQGLAPGSGFKGRGIIGITSEGDTVYFKFGLIGSKTDTVTIVDFLVMEHGMALRSSSTNASILT
ncbi:hypothetical protein COX84_06375, partial [Candidatus Micrarchaeota archaeon CG_4_10_14_0_2_um_filter_49_7]